MNPGLFCASVSLVLLSLTAQAQSLTNLQGTWNSGAFTVPSRLTLQQTLGKVTNIPEATAFGIESGLVTVAANGSFSSGEDNGQLQFAGEGVVVATQVGDDTISFRINSSYDVMVGAAREGIFQDLNFALKAPATLSVADLTGRWNIVSMDTPAAYTFTRGSNNVIRDINPKDRFELFTGFIQIASNGVVTGSFDGPVNSTLAVGSNGQVQVTSDDEEITTFMVNASKDVMFGFEYPSTQLDAQSIFILTRAPDSVSLADLKGNWKLNYFDTPNQLTVTYDADGDLDNIFEKDHFVFAQQSMSLGHDGFFTGQFDSPSVGSLAIGPNGAITATVTNQSLESETVTLYLNRSKNVMAGVLSDSFAQEILVFTRAPAVTNVVREMGLASFDGALVWAADTNRALAKASRIDSQTIWLPLTNTVGQHRYTPTPTQAQEYYRVVETN